MPDPADMLLFVTVVREGGFTRAALSLGLTKQSVSERIARLESSLGVRLLARTTRTVRPTDAGARYYERLCLVAGQLEDANREVQQLQAEAVGMLRISAPLLYGRRYLGPVIGRYVARYPKVRCELVLADQYVNLIESGFDLAIRVGVLDDSSLTARKLGTAAVYYVASPKFFKQHGPLGNLEQLRRAPCISVRAGESWELHGHSFKLDPVLMVNDLEAACSAAVHGVGVARLPSLLCADEVRGGRLQILFDGEAALQRVIQAVYPSRQYIPPKVRFFVEELLRSSTELGLDQEAAPASRPSVSRPKKGRRR